MAHSVTHNFIASKPDPVDSTIIGTSKWNAAHDITIDLSYNAGLTGTLSNTKLANSTITLGTSSVNLGDTLSVVNGLEIASPVITGGRHTNSDFFSFNTAASAPSYTAGQMYWNVSESTVNVDTGIGNSVLQIGQESLIKIYNDTGSTIPRGSVVYIVGADSDMPTVALAMANLESSTDTSIGVATHDIANMTRGFVTSFGKLTNYNTSSWTPGTPLYLSATNAGQLTSNPAQWVIRIGYVLTQHETLGTVLVDIDSVTRTATTINFGDPGNSTIMTNVHDFYRYSWSAGIINGCSITDNGDGTVSIDSGEVMIRTSNNDTAELVSLVVPATNNIVMNVNDVTHLYVSYSGGNPVWNATTDRLVVDNMTNVIGFIVSRNVNTLSIVDLRKINIDPDRKYNQQITEFDGCVFNGWSRSILGQSTPTTSGTNVLIGAGKYFYNGKAFTHPQYDTTVSGTAVTNVFTYFYNRTGSWDQLSNQKTINSTEYDNSGTLVNLSANYWRADHLFVVQGTYPYLVSVMGDTEHQSFADAASSVFPTLPPHFSEIAVFIGKSVIQAGSSNPVILPATGISVDMKSMTHNKSSSIQGGTQNEYYHLTNAEYVGTGTGNFVRSTSPSLTTPNIGVATATSLNKVTITQPATSATLTIANGKIVTANNSLTFAGTDGATITFQSSDTYVGRTTTDTLSNKSISLATNTVTGTTSQFNAALTDDNFATISGSETLINKSINGAFNTITNLPNASLAYSAITIGSTAVQLGTTITSLTSLSNIGIGTSSFGSNATNSISILDGVAPTSSPTNVGQLYVEAGALKFRSKNGTVTTIAPA